MSFWGIIWSKIWRVWCGCCNNNGTPWDGQSGELGDWESPGISNPTSQTPSLSPPTSQPYHQTRPMDDGNVLALHILIITLQYLSSSNHVICILDTKRQIMECYYIKVKCQNQYLRVINSVLIDIRITYSICPNMFIHHKYAQFG